MNRIPEVALITHDISQGGGTATMTTFLYQALNASGRYRPRLISLSTSRTDEASVRLLDPRSWTGGPQLVTRRYRDLDYVHVGAWFTEFEFQRYQYRRALARAVEGCDLIQFVVGIPAWAHAAIGANQPIAIWSATTGTEDRASRYQGASVMKRAFWSFMMPIVRWHERKALTAAAVVFGLSDYSLASLRKLGARSERSRVAPCGVNTDLFRVGIQQDERYFLSVGRFSDPRKNISLLLRAYAEVARTTPQCPRLSLVGEPPPASALQQIEDLEIADRVKFLGLQHGEQLAALYRGADLFLLSSDEEGFGIVVLEAMASGIPVVSTRCGGPETAIEHGVTGLLTPVGEPAPFAAAIRQLTENGEERAAMGESARRVAVERFSVASSVAPFIDAYDRILGIAQPSRASDHIVSLTA